MSLFTNNASLVFILLVTGALSLSPALSQQGGSAYHPPATKWGAPKDNPNNGNIVALREPKAMAGLPDFTGHAKFIYGSVRDWELGQGWTQFFHVQEPREQVFQWYTNVFQGADWKITANNGNQIMAKNRDGNTAVITVVDNKSPTTRCALTIAYFIPKK